MRTSTLSSSSGLYGSSCSRERAQMCTRRTDCRDCHSTTDIVSTFARIPHSRPCSTSFSWLPPPTWPVMVPRPFAIHEPNRLDGAVVSSHLSVGPIMLPERERLAQRPLHVELDAHKLMVGERERAEHAGPRGDEPIAAVRERRHVLVDEEADVRTGGLALIEAHVDGGLVFLDVQVEREEEDGQRPYRHKEGRGNLALHGAESFGVDAEVGERSNHKAEDRRDESEEACPEVEVSERHEEDDGRGDHTAAEGGERWRERDLGEAAEDVLDPREDAGGVEHRGDEAQPACDVRVGRDGVRLVEGEDERAERPPDGHEEGVQLRYGVAGAASLDRPGEKVVWLEPGVEEEESRHAERDDADGERVGEAGVARSLAGVDPRLDEEDDRREEQEQQLGIALCGEYSAQRAPPAAAAARAADAYHRGGRAHVGAAHLMRHDVSARQVVHVLVVHVVGGDHRLHWRRGRGGELPRRLAR
mmetsp:Transcript_15319/g.32327  ORF Transcript_15319/g.32327 Transcript_15319/m.32327 type:complete len:474 (-) Transcript_15319:26-1447(-)